MKQRFSSLDVKVIAHELSNSLCSLRLSNVYDLSTKIFLLKFAKPNHRQQLVIDSGFRCHLTSFNRTTAAAPSAFITRLRKFLRTRRVTSISQVGTDRIIEIQFSDGAYRLFLEFYAGGNIILTDKELGILALQRIVSEGSEQEELRVGLKYSVENRQNYHGVPALNKERVREGLLRATERSGAGSSVPAKKSKKKAGNDLRKALATSLTEFPPLLIDHAFRVKDFDAATPVEEVLSNEMILEKLVLVLGEAQKVVQQVISTEASKGYIIAKEVKPAASAASPQSRDENERAGRQENLMYEDFHPFRPQQFENIADTRILEYEGFNNTVDEFFSSIEAQKLESRLTEREEHAKKKLENARQDHEKRLGGLQVVQELNVRKAQAIEANLSRVQEAIAAVNGLIGQGMDWVEIARLIEMEQARQNPVADMIRLPLKLYENTVTLSLAELDFDDVEDFEGDETDSDISDGEIEQANPAILVKAVDKRLAVDVDLSLSPWANARQYYDQKKSAAVKEQKTLHSSAKALKSTEKKITADLKKGLKQEKDILRPVRKQIWFEKFLFFISSDGYLILGGKDVQQSDILYRRHLKKGDVYVHADLQGASSVVIKNKPLTPDAPIPPSSLSQAGTLAVATSSAWDSKAVMAPWWVKADQISKIAATGEYLSPGNFVIKGSKNFLPPAQLLLGFAVLFHISDESKARHLKHRLQDENDPNKPSVPDVESSSTKVQHEDINVQEGPHSDDMAELLSEEEQHTNKVSEEQDQYSSAEARSPNGNNEGENIGDGEEEEEEDDDDNDSGSIAEPENPLLSKAPLLENTIDQTLDRVLPEEELQEDEEPDSDGSDEGYATDGNVADLEDNQPKGEDRQSAVEESEPPTVRIASSGIRHLSTRERRLLRKGQNPSQPALSPTASADLSSRATNPASSSITGLSTAPSINNMTSAPPPQPHVRGKHGKRNKLKQKYANQDESDRALALRLLGSTTSSEKATDDAASKAAREAETEKQKQRRREQHARAAAAGKEEEEKRAKRLGGEEDNDEDGEGENEELSMLDAFVGTPLPGDEILDVIVMCAPWDAVGSKFRWRVKMQPGAMKKGKAVKEILAKWNAQILETEKRRPRAVEDETDVPLGESEELRRREAELVKGLREQEVVGMVPVGR
ncbi:MAG: hypothetical protein LQ347_002596, partial [Umbilicaria vellea]